MRFLCTYLKFDTVSKNKNKNKKKTRVLGKEVDYFWFEIMLHIFVFDYVSTEDI